MVTLLTRLGISWRKLSIGGKGWDLVHRVLSLHFPFSLTEGSLCLRLIGSKVSSPSFQSRRGREYWGPAFTAFDETKINSTSRQPQLQQSSTQCLFLSGNPCASITGSSYPLSLPLLPPFPLPLNPPAPRPIQLFHNSMNNSKKNQKVTRFLHIGEKLSISREEAKSDGHSTHQSWNSLWERG